jgi:hypothetical protein
MGNYLVEAVEKTAVGKRLGADSGVADWHFECLSCPVLIKFTLDGFPTTFRARGSYWWFVVGEQGASDELNNEREQLLNLRTFYDNAPHAGYMELEDAYVFIEQAIILFRRVRERSPVTFGSLERKTG